MGEREQLLKMAFSYNRCQELNSFTFVFHDQQIDIEPFIHFGGCNIFYCSYCAFGLWPIDDGSIRMELIYFIHSVLDSVMRLSANGFHKYPKGYNIICNYYSLFIHLAFD